MRRPRVPFRLMPSSLRVAPTGPRALAWSRVPRPPRRPRPSPGSRRPRPGPSGSRRASTTSTTWSRSAPTSSRDPARGVPPGALPDALGQRGGPDVLVLPGASRGAHRRRPGRSRARCGARCATTRCASTRRSTRSWRAARTRRGSPAGSTTRSARPTSDCTRLGWAHSVEAWRDGRLVGGLYGVAIGGLFAGESMFHRERDASKVALVALVRRPGRRARRGPPRRRAVVDAAPGQPRGGRAAPGGLPETAPRDPRAAARRPSSAAPRCGVERRMGQRGRLEPPNCRGAPPMKHALIAASLVLVAGTVAGCGGDTSSSASSKPTAAPDRPPRRRRSAAPSRASARTSPSSTPTPRTPTSSRR